MIRLKSPALRMGNGSIPVDQVEFDINGAAADIMTSFLDMAQEHQGPHPFSYGDIIAFSLKEFGAWPPATRTPSCAASGPTPSSISWKTPGNLLRPGEGRPRPHRLRPALEQQPQLFLEVAGWPDLARLSSKTKGKAARGTFPSAFP